jgi:hydrolase
MLICFQGSPEWIQRLIRVLQDRGLDISHVLLTHWHRDHTGGAPDLVAFDPSFAHRIYKNQPDRDQNPIEDGQVFAVEGATIRAVFTPGHAVDHMCFLLEEENALFTGDNVLGHGYSVVMDLAVYMNSLDYMAAKGCATGYPGHGAKIANLPAKMHEYIHHNEVRIQKVLSALTWKGTGMKGGMTLQEIIRSIYGDVQGDIADYALAPFLTQILWKLAEDGKVGFSPGEPKKARWFGLGGVRKATSIAASVVSDSD